MLQATFKKYQLHFNAPVLTSRGKMEVKNGYFLFITDGEKTGTGECSFIEGHSRDNLENYEAKLQQVCKEITSVANAADITEEFPSIAFGLETALLDLRNGGNKILFESGFTKGQSKIPINGLVWMGSKEFMHEQIQKKLDDGFKCIKIKVGAIDFTQETELLAFIRSQFPADIIEIRLDANGAFKPDDVFKKLELLSKFHIHSIEQPVKQGQTDLMQKVCAESPVPVCLDEELIQPQELNKRELLDAIKPQYIILKPSLLGGFAVCNEWIELAAENKIGWWATSALESNIGLNAIAQWVYTKQTNMVQGLGTGQLYKNNISSPLYISRGELGYDLTKQWDTL
jgi:o-succinylbenzoate synthase